MRLIIADDSAEMRWVVRTALEDELPDVTEVENGRQLFWLLLRESFAAKDDDLVVIADVFMPCYNGLEVLDAWHDPEQRVPMIVITSFPDDAIRARVEQLGAALLPKPFSRATLRKVVADATRRS